MTPRITLTRTEDGRLEIWLNEAGRDLLVKELQGLSEQSDHFHFGPSEEDAEVPVRSIAYRPDDEVLDWGKVLFRTDAWDAEHFPHVLG